MPDLPEPLDLDAKRARLRRLLEARLDAPAAPAGPEDAPPSAGQRALWFLQQLDPLSAAFTIATVVPLPPHAPPAAVRAALARVMARHAALRATFHADGGEPVQRFHPPGDVQMETVDAAGWTADEARRAAAERFARPFDLAAGPLLRAHLLAHGDGASTLLLFVHHLVADTVSLHVVADELLRTLAAEAAGAAPDLPPLAATYADYVRAEGERLDGPEGERLARYWLGRFPDGLPTLDLRPEGTPGRARAVHTFAWDGPLVEAVAAFQRDAGTTAFVTLLAAFAVVLQRYAGQDLVPVGTAAHGRDRPALRRVVGYLATPVLLGLDLGGDPSFRTLVGRVQETVWGAMEHGAYPFPRLVERLHPERGEAPTIQVQFVHQAAAALEAFGGRRHDADADVPGALTDVLAALLTATLHRGGEASLSVELFTTSRTLLGGLAYDPGVFSAEAVAGLAAAFRTVLAAAVAAPDRPLSALPLRAAPSGPEPAPEPAAVPPGGLATRFEAQAARTPGAVAVEHGHERWTYADLDARANALADALLADAPLPPGTPVGVVLPRSPALVAALLGVLKTGAAYLPLDPDQPAERLAALLEDAGAPIVLVAGDGPPLGPGRRVLDVDRLPVQGAGPPPRPVDDPERPAYLVYTSGSTGAPKGVVVPHRAVVRLVVGADYAPLTAADRVACASNPAFDAATFEVWGALLNGGTLVVLDADDVLDPARLAEALRARAVTTAFFTTALFNLVARAAPDAFRTLRRVLFGGEAADPEAVARVLRYGSPEDLLHVYGPTEDTTFTTWHRVTHVPPEAATVPIGRPVAGTTVHVLDAAGHPVPDGFPGELYAGGAGLARGYHGRPDLTAAAFVHRPHAGTDARLYRTGDLVRRGPDGALVFLGRLDRQVKVRGFRVEPGEVEAVLARHPAVGGCAVEATDPGPAGRTLIAFVVPAGGAAPEAEALRAHCAARLPAPLVPARFVVVPRIPLTANGKADRRALLRSAAAQPAAPDAPGEAPRDDVEQRLVELYERVLGRGGLGRDAHFFRLGGHSLLAVRLVAEIREAFGVVLPLRALFTAPAVGQLADLVRRADGGARFAAAVPVQPSGARPTLFLVPGAGGDATQFYRLSLHLGADQPFVVLESQGRDGLATPHGRIESMAAYGLEALRSVQPRGPYALLGYSAGGLVAFEMAGALRRQGEAVSFLGIVDAVNPRAAARVEAAPPRRARAGTPRALFGRVRRYVAFRAGLLRDTLALYARFYGHRLLGRAVPEETVAAFLYRVQRRAFLLHRPRPFDGRIVLFRTEDHPPGGPPDLGWGGLAAGGVEVHAIPGTHLTILHEPDVAPFAEAVRTHLPWPAGRDGAAGSPPPARLSPAHPAALA